MFQVRIHGRGGQGVVTAAELLSVAAFNEGRYAQAFPSFGSERMGAPVISYCRMADGPIRTHEPIAEPDALIVQDPTLLHQPGLLTGLRPDGFLLINSAYEAGALGLDVAAATMKAGRRLLDNSAIYIFYISPGSAGAAGHDPAGAPAARSRAAGRIRRRVRPGPAGVGGRGD